MHDSLYIVYQDTECFKNRAASSSPRARAVSFLYNLGISTYHLAVLSSRRIRNGTILLMHKRSLQHTISPYAMLSQRQYVGSNRWLLSSSNSSIKFKSLSSSMICFSWPCFLCFLRLLCCGKPAFAFGAIGGVTLVAVSLTQRSLVIFGCNRICQAVPSLCESFHFRFSFLPH